MKHLLLLLFAFAMLPNIMAQTPCAGYDPQCVYYYMGFTEDDSIPTAHNVRTPDGFYFSHIGFDGLSISETEYADPVTFDAGPENYRSVKISVGEGSEYVNYNIDLDATVCITRAGVAWDPINPCIDSTSNYKFPIEMGETFVYRFKLMIDTGFIDLIDTDVAAASDSQTVYLHRLLEFKRPDGEINLFEIFGNQSSLLLFYDHDNTDDQDTYVLRMTYGARQDYFPDLMNPGENGEHSDTLRWTRFRIGEYFDLVSENMVTFTKGEWLDIEYRIHWDWDCDGWMEMKINGWPVPLGKYYVDAGAILCSENDPVENELDTNSIRVYGPNLYPIDLDSPGTQANCPCYKDSLKYVQPKLVIGHNRTPNYAINGDLLDYYQERFDSIFKAPDENLAEKYLNDPESLSTSELKRLKIAVQFVEGDNYELLGLRIDSTTDYCDDISSCSSIETLALSSTPPNISLLAYLYLIVNEGSGGPTCPSGFPGFNHIISALQNCVGDRCDKRFPEVHTIYVDEVVIYRDDACGRDWLGTLTNCWPPSSLSGTPQCENGPSVLLTWGPQENAVKNVVFQSRDDSKELLIHVYGPTDTDDRISYAAPSTSHSNSFEMISVCSTTYSFPTDTITVLNPNCKTGELTVRSEVSVFPNPADNKLFLKGNSDFAEYSIYDVWGKRICLNRMDGKSINISDLSSGTYYIKFHESQTTGEDLTYVFVKN